MKIKLSIIVLLILCMSSCVNNQKSNETLMYRFEITGTFNPSKMYSNTIMFTDPEGNPHKWNNVTSGWSYSWEQKGQKQISIDAMNTSGEGDMVIKLYRNNELIETKIGYGGGFPSIIGSY